MTRLAQLTFALLVCATLGAFFVTQRLKRSPLVVRQRTVTDAFSPNGDGIRDRASIRFSLQRSDDVTVAIVDREGSVVRLLATDRREPGRQALQFIWDGRNQNHRVVPDGPYRVRIGLRNEGRTVTLRRQITVDTTPPRPTVSITSPGGAGPALFPAPGVRAVTVHTETPLFAAPRFQVYRMDAGAPRLVARFLGAQATGQGAWDGRITGGPAPAGLYAIAVRTSDRVGNQGVSPPFGPPPAHAGQSRNGVIVRYLTARTHLEPVSVGAQVTAAVDGPAAGRYDWTLTRPGVRRPLARGKGAGTALRLTVPRQASGIDILTVRAGSFRAQAPLLVRGPAHHAVLLVVPAASWQAANPYDDDGNGVPNTLDRGGPVGLDRPFAGSGLPAGFSRQEAPLLAFLDGAGLRYDITTDVALARGGPPMLQGHRGAVLAGVPRWLPAAAAPQLSTWVDGGGRVLLFGTDALRRTAQLSGNQLSRPTGPTAVDALGDRQVPLAQVGQLPVLRDDRLGLFTNTDGLLTGFGSGERSEGLGSKVQSAAGPQEGQPVVVAYSLGKGLVIRTGLSGWSALLGRDGNVDAVTRRAWSLLSR
ncbi:MAG TPA: N,N-dimethylformamidase beta subunit family domain-containing protein [Solirubrobacteraceae bacterium]|nr:N,N-dimethylformamidase beta subunit family domain-containing protein [Solirubrobacteraceae bacterium]